MILGCAQAVWRTRRAVASGFPLSVMASLTRSNSHSAAATPYCELKYRLWNLVYSVSWASIRLVSTRSMISLTAHLWYVPLGKGRAAKRRAEAASTSLNSVMSKKCLPCYMGGLLFSELVDLNGVELATSSRGVMRSYLHR